jgi:hypothetical protein
MNRDTSFETKAQQTLEIGERHLDVDNGHLTKSTLREITGRRSPAQIHQMMRFHQDSCLTKLKHRDHSHRWCFYQSEVEY